MLSTNFEENFIPEINELLRFVLENEHSDFYRKKYANLVKYPIKSYEDFQKIPLLSKDEFLAYRIEDRIFLPIDEINSYSFSSGTTGHPIPTIIPHVNSDYGSRKGGGTLNYELFKELGIKKVLILMLPTSDLFKLAFSSTNPSSIMLPGDIHNLKIMAKIIKTLSVNGILTTPTILDSLIEELQLINFDFSSVGWISIGSEFCSNLRYSYFKSKFPNAFFHIRYGNSEIGGTRHYRCQHLAKNGAPNVFHIKPDSGLIEIIDENGKLASEGQSGEIIYSDLKNKAFPFLRYKMRDIANLSTYKCPCGNEVIFTLDGRANFDVLKTHGTTIHAELIAKAVGKIQDFVELRHQLHIYEEKINGKPKLKLVLHLKLRPEYSDSTKDTVFLSILEEKISSSLQLSSKMNLIDFVSKGIISPLEIKFVSNWPENIFKSRNIISHII